MNAMESDNGFEATSKLIRSVGEGDSTREFPMTSLAIQASKPILKLPLNI